MAKARLGLFSVYYMLMFYLFVSLLNSRMPILLYPLKMASKTIDCLGFSVVFIYLCISPALTFHFTWVFSV